MAWGEGARGTCVVNRVLIPTKMGFKITIFFQNCCLGHRYDFVIVKRCLEWNGGGRSVLYENHAAALAGRFQVFRRRKAARTNVILCSYSHPFVCFILFHIYCCFSKSELTCGWKVCNPRCSPNSFTLAPPLHSITISVVLHLPRTKDILRWKTALGGN